MSDVIDRGGTAAPATPPLPGGWAIRPYAGPADHVGMAPALTAVRAADGNLDGATVEGMTTHYAHLGDELRHDCLVVERDGVVVGYSRVTHEPEADGTLGVHVFVVLPPDHRDLGAEPAILARQLDRALEVLRRAAPTRATRLGAYVQGSHAALATAVEAAGFRLTQEGANLVRPDLETIPDVPLPDGYELRPVPRGDVDLARRIYHADKRAFADQRGESAASEAEFMDRYEAPSNQPELQQVAWHGDEIAGMVMAYLAEPAEDGTVTGMTEGISVQPEHRRRGLARAMLVAALRAVRDAGATRAALSVDLANPNQARVLYESLGFRIVGSERVYEAGRWAAGETPSLPARAGGRA